MNNHVRFEELPHTYHHSNTGETYTSATQIIGKYKPPFNARYWSAYKALQRLLEENGLEHIWLYFKSNHLTKKPQEEAYFYQVLEEQYPEFVHYTKELQPQILDEWDETKEKACIKGTAYHVYREKAAYENGYEILVGTEVIAQTSSEYHFSLRDLPDGYYPELLVYNHDYKIAGQVDKVWITSEYIDPKTVKKYDPNHIWYDSEERPYIRYVDLDDWKTNRVIKETNKYQKMLPPLNKLPDCNKIHYELQVSLYAWMLSQEGYLPRYTRFTHIKAILDGEGKEQPDPFNNTFLAEEIPYPFKYRQIDIENLLLDYRLNRECTKSNDS